MEEKVVISAYKYKVLQWYRDFKNLDLDKVVSVFADDAVVTYGSGASDTAIQYSGQFTGIDNIRQYYAGRFAKGARLADIRPLCAAAPTLTQCGRWVTSFGQIQDTPSADGNAYIGPFMQVWSFHPLSALVTSLDSFFDVDSSGVSDSFRVEVEHLA
jgi:hypothetical protein